MFSLKTLAKKIVAYTAAAAISISAIFMPAPVAEAGVADAIGSLILGGIQAKSYRKQVDVMNKTEEGRQQLFQDFREHYGVNNDYALNARLDSIMSTMSRAVSKVDPSIGDKPYLYFISADETLNAGCSMGHVMMVNTGAFKHLVNDDEIAAVIGHEMGHGQKDHAAKGFKKRLNKAVLAQAAANAVGGDIAGIVGSLALTHSIAHGTKKQETEADNLAWEYMLNTNYNLGATAAVMQKLWELAGEKNHGSFINPSDHPDTDKRRDSYVKKLEEYSGKHVNVREVNGNGVIFVNGRQLMSVAAANGMSSLERTYFVMGNLAKAYHDGQNKSSAKVNGNVVLLGTQPIVEVASGDDDAATLAERLNSIK